MDKIYVVKNKREFEKYCRNKLQIGILFNEEVEIHLVPRYYNDDDIHKYITNYKQKYDMYLYIGGLYIKEDRIELDENNIKDLINDDLLIDYQERKKWHEHMAFKINDKDEFIKILNDKLSELEKLLIVNSKFGDRLGRKNIYLIKNDSNFYLLIRKLNFKNAYALSRTEISYSDLDNLIIYNIIERIECNINYEKKKVHLSTENGLAHISSRKNFDFPRILDNGKRVIVTSRVSNPKYEPTIIRGYGRNKDEVLRNLRIRLEYEYEKQKNIYENRKVHVDDFSERSIGEEIIKNLLGHSDNNTKEIAEKYNELFDSTEDIDI